MTHYFARYKDVVDDWEAFMEAAKRPLPTTIWANSLKIKGDELTQRLQKKGIDLTPIPWIEGGFRLPAGVQPGLLWEYMAGLFHVQEEVSMLPIKLLDVQPEHTVLDMCAAPGNKTAQIGVALHNKGTVVANDRSRGRMRAARQTFNRLGLVNISMHTRDASNLPRSLGQFDRVLADVPCTCEGTCRKEPSVMVRSSTNGSLKMARTQKAILRKAIQLCKPGGKILYATCTFAPEENELVLQEMLETMPDKIRILPASIDGFVTAPGLTEWNGRILHPSLQNALRAWPHHNDTGGFFMALLEKADSDQPISNLTTTGRQSPIPIPHPPLPLEHEPWLTQLCARFGFNREVFDPYEIIRWSKRGVYVVNKDHFVPESPQPDAVGMLFMRTDGRFPKLTTAAGMLFGKHATQNNIEMRAEQADAYFARQDFQPTPSQITQCTATGYVILSYQNVPVGVGIYHSKSQTVESNFPKGWVRKNVII